MSELTGITIGNTYHAFFDPAALNPHKRGKADFSDVMPEFFNHFQNGIDETQTELTSEHFSMIANGDFSFTRVGDVFGLNGQLYRVLGFDYFYGRGALQGTTTQIVDDHHMVLGTCIGQGALASSASTAGGYQSVKTTTLNSLISSWSLPVDSSHLLHWYDSWPNAVTNGRPTAGGWYETYYDLMTETQVFGQRICSSLNVGSNTDCWNHTLSNIQFPWFNMYSHCADLFGLGLSFSDSNLTWLRDIASSERFCAVDSGGRPNTNKANSGAGINYICVYFCIK